MSNPAQFPECAAFIQDAQRLFGAKCKYVRNEKGEEKGRPFDFKMGQNLLLTVRSEAK
jgi:hypothetical protein